MLVGSFIDLQSSLTLSLADMKAKGLDALASAAAGSPQASAEAALEQVESTTATLEAPATPMTNPASGSLSLGNLTPQQQQQILQLLQHQTNASQAAAAAQGSTAQASALLNSIQQMSQSQNPLLTLQGLQQQLASQQLLQLLMNRQQNGGATQQQAPVNTASNSNFMDTQNAQKLQALLGNLPSHSKHGTSLV